MSINCAILIDSNNNQGDPMKFYSLLSLLVLPMALASACKSDSHDKPAPVSVPAASPDSQSNQAPVIPDKVLVDLLDQLEASNCTISPPIEGVVSCPDPANFEEAEALFSQLHALKKHISKNVESKTDEVFLIFWQASIDRAITKVESSNFMVEKETEIAAIRTRVEGFLDGKVEVSSNPSLSYGKRLSGMTMLEELSQLAVFRAELIRLGVDGLTLSDDNFYFYLMATRRLSIDANDDASAILDFLKQQPHQ